jgi:hypothetical protein
MADSMVVVLGHRGHAIASQMISQQLQGQLCNNRRDAGGRKGGCRKAGQLALTQQLGGTTPVQNLKYLNPKP